jgi:hypothetical protein
MKILIATIGTHGDVQAHGLFTRVHYDGFKKVGSLQSGIIIVIPERFGLC